MSALCARFGVSRGTGYKFLRRFRRYGAAGLRLQQRGPKGLTGRQRRHWQRRVLRLRRARPSWGARKLCWWLRQGFSGPGRIPCERTVQRWIGQAGLTRVTRTRARRVQPAAGVRAKVARCSNAVWTIDLKGWFRTGDGSKVEPLTVRDFWSRYLLWIRHLAPRDERAVRRVCERLFRRHGRPLVMRCDLGSLFLGDGPHGFTRLSLWWWRLGIQVEFVRHGFVDNNAHEQRHRVLKADTARPPAHTLRAQARRLARWRRLYNHHRPHEALGLRPPSTRYRSAPALLPPLAAPHYPKHWLVRRVRNNGEINLPGWSGSIGRAFSGLSVGLQPTGPQRFRVYFANLVLGELDLAGARKLRIRPF